MKKTVILMSLLLFVISTGCKPKKPPSIIELGLSTCEHCMDMKKILDDVEKENKGKVKTYFYDMDTPKGKELELLYDVKNIPTIIFLDENGLQYFKSDNALLKEQILAILKVHKSK